MIDSIPLPLYDVGPITAHYLQSTRNNAESYSGSKGGDGTSSVLLIVRLNIFSFVSSHVESFDLLMMGVDGKGRSGLGKNKNSLILQRVSTSSTTSVNDRKVRNTFFDSVRTHKSRAQIKCDDDVKRKVEIMRWKYVLDRTIGRHFQKLFHILSSEEKKDEDSSSLLPERSDLILSLNNAFRALEEERVSYQKDKRRYDPRSGNFEEGMSSFSSLMRSGFVSIVQLSDGEGVVGLLRAAPILIKFNQPQFYQNHSHSYTQQKNGGEPSSFLTKNESFESYVASQQNNILSSTTGRKKRNKAAESSLEFTEDEILMTITQPWTCNAWWDISHTIPSDVASLWHLLSDDVKRGVVHLLGLTRPSEFETVIATVSPSAASVNLNPSSIGGSNAAEVEKEQKEKIKNMISTKYIIRHSPIIVPSNAPPLTVPFASVVDYLSLLFIDDNLIENQRTSNTTTVLHENQKRRLMEIVDALASKKRESVYLSNVKKRMLKAASFPYVKSSQLEYSQSQALLTSRLPLDDPSVTSRSYKLPVLARLLISLPCPPSPSTSSSSICGPLLLTPSSKSTDNRRDDGEEEDLEDSRNTFASNLPSISLSDETLSLGRMRMSEFWIVEGVGADTRATPIGQVTLLSKKERQNWLLQQQVTSSKLASHQSSTSFLERLNDDFMSDESQSSASIHKEVNASSGAPVMRSHNLHIVSIVCGILYVCLWAGGSYPQIWLNWERKSCYGFSFDKSLFNTVGYTCYFLYTFISYVIQQIYQLPKAVEGADLFFATNCMVVLTIIETQIRMYSKPGDGDYMNRALLARIICLILVSTIPISTSMAAGTLIPWTNIEKPLDSPQNFILSKSGNSNQNGSSLGSVSPSSLLNISIEPVTKGGPLVSGGGAIPAAMNTENSNLNQNRLLITSLMSHGNDKLMRSDSQDVRSVHSRRRLQSQSYWDEDIVDAIFDPSTSTYVLKNLLTATAQSFDGILASSGSSASASSPFISRLPPKPVSIPSAHGKGEVTLVGGLGRISNRISVLSLLGYIKVVCTFIKYIPQINLNISRQSTLGMSALHLVSDLMGAFFAIMQNVVDAYNFDDMTYITGNIPKIAIAAVSAVFCLILTIQHVFVYGPVTPVDETSHHHALSEKHFEEDDAQGAGHVTRRSRRYSSAHPNRNRSRMTSKTFSDSVLIPVDQRKNEPVETSKHENNGGKWEQFTTPLKNKFSFQVQDTTTNQVHFSNNSPQPHVITSQGKQRGFFQKKTIENAEKRVDDQAKLGDFFVKQKLSNSSILPFDSSSSDSRHSRNKQSPKKRKQKAPLKTNPNTQTASSPNAVLLPSSTSPFRDDLSIGPYLEDRVKLTSGGKVIWNENDTK
eukprot:GDKK01054566.1.p1 GENE.GDKK01054566.1~~GDKK01054566.1.p1  ORF type:complete len:1383 (-),score=310.03 GDKK01054566.1:72-4136(-)